MAIHANIVRLLELTDWMKQSLVSECVIKIHMSGLYDSH
jgi:hypothetical protein